MSYLVYWTLAEPVSISARHWRSHLTQFGYGKFGGIRSREATPTDVLRRLTRSNAARWWGNEDMMGDRKIVGKQAASHTLEWHPARSNSEDLLLRDLVHVVRQKGVVDKVTRVAQIGLQHGDIRASYDIKPPTQRTLAAVHGLQREWAESSRKTITIRKVRATATKIALEALGGVVEGPVIRTTVDPQPLVDMLRAAGQQAWCAQIQEEVTL